MATVHRLNSHRLAIVCVLFAMALFCALDAANGDCWLGCKKSTTWKTTTGTAYKWSAPIAHSWPVISYNPVWGEGDLNTVQPTNCFLTNAYLKCPSYDAFQEAAPFGQNLKDIGEFDMPRECMLY